MSTPWVIEIDAVADKTGALTQLFDPRMPAGDAALGSNNPGQKVRAPTGGKLIGVEIETDGTNGGEIEIWDISGHDAGANVSTGTAITNAQKNGLITRNKARLLWSQKFAASAANVKVDARMINFSHGLAARYIVASPGGKTVSLNLNVDGGGVLRG